MITWPLVINTEAQNHRKIHIERPLKRSPGSAVRPDQEAVPEGSWKSPRMETAQSLWTVCTVAGLLSWGKNVPLQLFWTCLISTSVVPHRPTMHCYEKPSSISLLLSPHVPAAAVEYPQITASPGCTSPDTPVPPCRTIPPAPIIMAVLRWACSASSTSSLYCDWHKTCQRYL